jgi:hypothetical protein
MRRRELLLAVAPVMAARAVRAQQKATPVIGWLSALSPSIQGGTRMPEVSAYESLPHRSRRLSALSPRDLARPAMSKEKI